MAAWSSFLSDKVSLQGLLEVQKHFALPSPALSPYGRSVHDTDQQVAPDIERLALIFQICDFINGSSKCLLFLGIIGGFPGPPVTDVIKIEYLDCLSG
jgi:hypothetical protein